MNDATPRRLGGTLLERAAARYELTPGMPAYPRVPQSAAAPTPAPVVFEPEPAAHSVMIDRAVLADGGMLVPGAPVTALAEEFRLVKRHLLLTARQVAATAPEKSRMMLVCSARPDDGKTFCAINLALSLAAEKDVEVVLADADFAKPDVLKALGVEVSGPGLLDAVADRSLDVERLIVDTDVPQLRLLPAGARSNNDTELLGSEGATAVLRRLASANPRRIVVLDSPPALAASPAGVLAEHVGQVMLVVRADQTTESELREAVALLDGCEHVQLVLNAVRFQPGGRRFGSYYGQETQP